MTDSKMIGIDLFAGAGGMSLGAAKAGVDVKLAVESDAYAAATFRANHANGEFSLFENDIVNLTPKYLNELGLMPNGSMRSSPLIVFGGPPCQGFSTSNQKTRTRANTKNWLYTEYHRVVQLTQPEWIVFENVKGIKETDGGIFLDEVVSGFETLGYETSIAILNAADHGVPQKRWRLFVIGSSRNSGFAFESIPKLPEVTVSEAIGDLPSLRNGDRIDVAEYSKPANCAYANLMRAGSNSSTCNWVTMNSRLVIERYRHVPQGGNWENIPDILMSEYKDKTRCHTGIYHRLTDDAPSKVIGNFRKNMLIHPTVHRGLSVREAARLQSFPDTFRFTGSIGPQQQQVGNAVPPLLAEQVFNAIITSAAS